MFKNIEIWNFRGIEHLKIDDFRRVNLLVGKNNSGKTTVLEALFLSAGPTNAQLPMNINYVFRHYKFVDSYFWKLIFNQLDINHPIQIISKTNGGQETRNLKIKPKIKSNFPTKIDDIDDGELTLIRESSSDTTSIINGLTLEYQLKKKSIDLQEFKTEITVSEKGDGISTSVSNYKESIVATYINKESMLKNLGKFFNEIQIDKKTDKLIKTLQKIEPNFRNLVLGSENRLFCDLGFDQLLPINVIGDGIFQVLSIMLTMYNRENGVVLIDEIDNGLHYSSLKPLWEAIFEMAKEFDVQIFATTHSYECVDVFSSVYQELAKDEKEDEVRLYRLDKLDEKLKAVSFTSEMIQTALDHNWEIR